MLSDVYFLMDFCSSVTARLSTPHPLTWVRVQGFGHMPASLLSSRLILRGLFPSLTTGLFISLLYDRGNRQLKGTKSSGPEPLRERWVVLGVQEDHDLCWHPGRIRVGDGVWLAILA